MTTDLQAGFARIKITPPMGINIPGYFKVRISDGIIDDLYIHATAIAKGDRRVLFLSCDVTRMYSNAYCKVKKEISDRCDIDEDAIYIYCTHNHTSFRVTACKSDAMDDTSVFMRRVFQQFCDVAQFAFEDLKPVTSVKTAVGEARDVGFIRRYRMKDGSCKTNPPTGSPDIASWDGEQDHSVLLVRLERENAPEILFVSFATHADVVSGTKYCTDWPGFTRKVLKGALGEVNVMMLIGCEGDSNHINRFLPKGAVPMKLACAKKMARKIAGEVLKIYDDAKASSFDRLDYAHKIVSVGCNPFDPADVPKAQEIHRLYSQIKDAKDPVFKKFNMSVPEASRIVRLLNGPQTFDLRISAIRLGRIVFVGFDGEPFAEIGRTVKKNSKMDFTVTTCLTNGGQGYFPSAKAFAEKGYERSISPFAHDVAQKLIDGALELIDELDDRASDHCSIT